MTAIRFPYAYAQAGQTPAMELAYLPITLSTVHGTMERAALLDTGSTVNVLPYTVGLALGFSWEQQRIAVELTGSLAKVPAYGVIVQGQVGSFPAVELAFAWTQAADVPLIWDKSTSFWNLMFVSSVRREPLK